MNHHRIRRNKAHGFCHQPGEQSEPWRPGPTPGSHALNQPRKVSGTRNGLMVRSWLMSAGLLLHGSVAAVPGLAQAPGSSPQSGAASTAATAQDTAQADDANTANNPLTIIPAVVLQNYYQPALKGSAGAGANQPILRAVVPHQAFGGSNLLRLSLPVGTAVWDGNSSQAGIGDLTIFNVRVFDLSPSTGVGVGPLVVAPTATDEALGSRQWQLGAQATVSSHFNWGLLAALVSYQQSVEGDANALTIQPFVFRNLGQGYYLRSSGIITFDTRSGDGVIPIGLGIGKVSRLASGNIVNVYVEPQVSVDANGNGQPEFQVFAGFNIQFPGKPKVAAAPATTSDTTAPAQKP